MARIAGKRSYSKSNAAKKDYKYVKDDRPGRTPKKKVYTGSKLSDTQAKAKKAMTSDKAYALPFGETFRAAKKAGKSKFRWKGNQFTTRTKKELETGVAEKEKFTREAKRKASPQSKGKKSWLKTFGESKTLKEFAKKMKARRS